MQLTLYLTDNCNMNCSYCVYEKHPDNMSSDVLIKACDLAFSRGKEAGLCFFGGEPLLMKELIYEALEYCKAKSEKTGIKCSFTMTTNGTLLDDEFLAKAKSAGMGIAVSFDGLAQDICRHFKGEEGSRSFDVLEAKSKLLLKYLPSSVAMATIAPEAVPYYFESVKYLHDLGFKKVAFVIAYGKKVSWRESDLIALKEQLEKTAVYLRDLYASGDDFIMGPLHSKISEFITGNYPAKRCHLGVKQMPVIPGGDLYPCTSFIGDEDYLLGNVFEGVNEEKVISLSKRNAIPETCRECDLKQRCTNSCGCANRLNTGFENKVSPLQCSYERIVINIADRLGEEMYLLDEARFTEILSKV